MTLPAPGRPTALCEAPRRRLTPGAGLLGTAPPVASVPMRLDASVFPDAPNWISTPGPLLPEIRFPRTVLPVAATPLISTPLERLPLQWLSPPSPQRIADVPSEAGPIVFPSTVL